MLAGSPVAGVKGVNETSFRTGNVILTPDNLGLTADLALSGYDYDTDSIAISAKERGGYDAIEIAKFHEKVFQGIAEGITKIKETVKGAVHRYGRNDSNTSYYAQIAHITITATQIDKPIMFKVATRDGKMSEVTMMFSGENSLDPGVKYFTIDGVNSAYAARTDAGEWDLFIYYRSWQDIDVVDYKLPNYLNDKVKVKWTQEFETTLPTGFVAATRVDSVLNSVEACIASTNSFDLAGAAAVKELNNRFATGTVSIAVANGFGTFSIDYNTFETIPFIVFQPIGYIISGNTVVSVVPVDITTSRANCRITFSIAFNGTVNLKWFAFGN